MCGIAGFFSDKKLDASEVLKGLNHRGPNANGVFERNFNGKNLLLAHTRLSIIDLSSEANQPMSFGEKVHLIFNGEIYNFKELRDEFLNKDSLKTNSDTEVLGLLYMKLGEDFVNHLNGDFAIAILDEFRDKLLLYRDRFGIKPLYLYRNENTFAFASEIKTFFKAGIKAEFEEKNFGKYLIYKYSPKQETLFKNIVRMAPATKFSLNLNTGQEVEEKYWTINSAPGSYKGSYSEACIELENHLKKAIDYRLIADVPVSNFLSGGIDSSAIAWFIRSHKDIKHYCAVKTKEDLIKEGTSSDGNYAAMLAKKWNLNFEEIPIGKKELNEELINASVFFADDLIADGSQIPSMLIAKKAAESSRVVLSGMGADEIFLGYNGHVLTLIDQMLQKFPESLSRKICDKLSRIEAGKGKFKAYKRYLFKLGRNFGKPNSYARYSVVGDVESALELLNPNFRPTDFAEEYFENNNDAFENLFQFEQENFLVKNLSYMDRTTMAFGLEARVPFLDHNLVDFVHSLPRSFKIGNNFKQKRILKDTLRNYLPNEIINRRKAGFGMPLRSLLSDKKRLEELIEPEFFANFKLILPEKLKELMNNHLSGRQDQSALLYALISFKFWYRIHIENNSTWNN